VLLRSTAMREKKKIGEIAQSILTASELPEMTTPLHIGFIPLVDAAALIVAVDKGFATAEGLDVTLVREVSWSNVRDNSISGCSTPHICWRRSRSPPASGSDTSRCRYQPLQSRPQRQPDYGVAGRCMPRSWRKSTATVSTRWRPRWRWRAWSPSAAGAAPNR